MATITWDSKRSRPSVVESDWEVLESDVAQFICRLKNGEHSKRVSTGNALTMSNSSEPRRPRRVVGSPTSSESSDSVEGDSDLVRSMTGEQGGEPFADCTFSETFERAPKLTNLGEGESRVPFCLKMTELDGGECGASFWRPLGMRKGDSRGSANLVTGARVGGGVRGRVGEP